MDLSNNVVVHKRSNGGEYLQFRKLLEYKEISHAYSLGLDVNFRTSRANNTKISLNEYNYAIECYKKFCKEIGCDYINIVKPNQNHTKKVMGVFNKYNSNKPDFNLEQYNNVDGLITNKKDIMLSTVNADCILLLFFDPVKGVIANVHSGWKGTLQRISVETVRKMKIDYECEPQNIICCICPSIRKCHFEVDSDVKELFYNEFKDLKQINEIVERTNNNSKWHIDTVLINKIILLEEGLKEENIFDCGICSVCNKNLIHSFRVEKQNYGLETALIMKK
jgi:YfiH family protein